MSTFWDRVAGLYDLTQRGSRAVNAARKGLAPVWVEVIPGRVPEGIGVLEKPA